MFVTDVLVFVLGLFLRLGLGLLFLSARRVELSFEEHFRPLVSVFLTLILKKDWIEVPIVLKPKFLKPSAPFW